MKTVLIGFGDIAEKYLPVLKELNCDVIGVVARNYEKALEKSKKFGITNVFKTIEDIPIDECDFLMNLTSADTIATTLKKIIVWKKPIFTEKPVGFGINEIQELINQNKKFNSNIMVGTNRRFYSIFHQALQFLKEHDKTIESIKIDAPERFSDINQEKFNSKIKENWMFANSIHCIDLIRFFGGDIKKIESNSIVDKYDFNANGICNNNIDFSYSSNWKKQSKWNISIFADEIKIIFEPIETGKIIMKNKDIQIIPSKEDLKFKPGFYAQISHFLENFVKKNEKKWPASDLEDHKKSIKLIEDIFIPTKD
jgi:predicted dehydrogenase